MIRFQRIGLKSNPRQVGISAMKFFLCIIAVTLAGAAGCSKDETPAPAPTQKQGGGGSPAGPGAMGGDGGEEMIDVSQTTGEGQPSAGTQPVSEDPEAPPVLAEMDGLYYEVYRIADKPFTGKVVEYHATNVEKSEKVYQAGRLMSLTEWHENAQKSREVTYAADGKITEKRWNKDGEEITAAANTSVGRGIEWTFGGGQSARRIDGYSGKSSELIKRVFGAPDEEQNGVWVYKSMKVVAVQSGQTMTVVRFTIDRCACS